MPATRTIEELTADLMELQRWRKEIDPWRSDVDTTLRESKTDRAEIRNIVGSLRDEFRLLGSYVKASVDRIEVQNREIRTLMMDVGARIGSALVIAEEAKLPCVGCPRLVEMVKNGIEEVDRLKREAGK